MTVKSERVPFFAFVKVFAIVGLFIAASVSTLSAQIDTSSESTQRPEATRAKYLAFYGTTRSDWATVAIPAAMSGLPYTWKIRKNAAGTPVSSTFNFGLDGDVVCPGSYTGDATFDLGMYRGGAAAATWIDPFDDGPGTPYTVIPYGTTSDNAGRNGDYDGDGIEDIAIIRVISNQLIWWIRLSSSPSTVRAIPFGNIVSGQQIFAFEGADFTGDGRDEIVVARVVNITGAATWQIADSVTGQQILQLPFGDWDTDFLINPADYTGDGKADLVVWRAGSTGTDNTVWFIRDTGTNTNLPPVWFGIGDPNFTNLDLPVRGDYDGDGKDDIAVWRPSTATFWVRASSDGSLLVQPWGATTDVPLGNFFTF